MDSHYDNDSPLKPKGLKDQLGSLGAREESLKRRVEALSESGQNVITAGTLGEEVLFNATSRGFLVRRLPDDPDNVLRISIGMPEWDENQSYLVFRGDPGLAERLLRRAIKAIRVAFNPDENKTPE